MIAARFVARVLIVCAGAALVTALCLFSLAGYFLTWPYRKSPANAAQIRAAVNAAMALAALVASVRSARGGGRLDREPQS